MSFFNRFFGKGAQRITPASPFQSFLEQCVGELSVKSGAHDAAWHISECSWSVDQLVGDIVFAHPNGVVASCPVQIVGTYNTIDGTWLWGWDHPSVAVPLQDHASKQPHG